MSNETTTAANVEQTPPATTGKAKKTKPEAKKSKPVAASKLPKKVGKFAAPNPKGLRKPQIRILKALVASKVPLDRATIAKRSKLAVSNVHGSLIKRSKFPEYPSLCELGYAVRIEREVEIGLRPETVWEATATGRKVAADL